MNEFSRFAVCVGETTLSSSLGRVLVSVVALPANIKSDTNLKSNLGLIVGHTTKTQVVNLLHGCAHDLELYGYFHSHHPFTPSMMSATHFHFVSLLRQNWLPWKLRLQQANFISTERQSFVHCEYRFLCCIPKSEWLIRHTQIANICHRLPCKSPCLLFSTAKSVRTFVDDNELDQQFSIPPACQSDIRQLRVELAGWHSCIHSFAFVWLSLTITNRLMCSLRGNNMSSAPPWWDISSQSQYANHQYVWVFEHHSKCFSSIVCGCFDVVGNCMRRTVSRARHLIVSTADLMEKSSVFCWLRQTPRIQWANNPNDRMGLVKLRWISAHI